MQIQEGTIEKFYEILNTFPKSYNGQRYLTLKNGRKLFFSLFIKKYWLDWNKTKYNSNDILRRVRMVEFFDFMTKEFEVSDDNDRYVLESYFFRMVIIETKKRQLQLLSFYNHK